MPAMGLLRQYAMMDPDVENLVTTADLEVFERDGVVVIRNAFAENWLGLSRRDRKPPSTPRGTVYPGRI